MTAGSPLSTPYTSTSVPSIAPTLAKCARITTATVLPLLSADLSLPACRRSHVLRPLSASPGPYPLSQLVFQSHDQPRHYQTVTTRLSHLSRSRNLRGQ